MGGRLIILGGSVAQLLFLGVNGPSLSFEFLLVFGVRSISPCGISHSPCPPLPRAAAGYHAARLYRTLKGTDWKKASLMTAMLYPSVVFGMGFFLNFFIWGEHSSGAVSHDVITGDFITNDVITPISLGWMCCH